MEEKRFKIKFPPFVIYAFFSLIIFVAIFLCVLISVPEGDFIVLKGAIGDKSSLINLSFVSLIISGINLVASWSLLKKDRVASHILGILAVFVPLIVLLKVSAIIFAY